MDNKKILVVEDSPTNLRMITGILREHGYNTITAVDGDEALKKTMQEQPQLILLDIILPKKNGFQVCRQLKTSPETADIQVLMLTSKSQDSDRYWGLKQGADGYMTKPFEEEALLAKVKEMI